MRNFVVYGQMGNQLKKLDSSYFINIHFLNLKNVLRLTKIISFFNFNFLLLFSYSCVVFLPIPPPHPSETPSHPHFHPPP